jgi:membrane fusion protein (multidrug efflux system)
MSTASVMVKESAQLPATKKSARPYVILTLVVVLGLGGFAVLRTVTAGNEGTDDAQVSADMVPVAARVGGAVLAVPVTDNQSVKAGQLLARLDPADAENRVHQAEAELHAAQAQAAVADAQMRIVEARSKGVLSTARAALSGTAVSVAGADAELVAAHAMLDRARADAQRTESDLNRAEQLARGQAIAVAQVETQRAQTAAARATLAEAQAHVTGAEQARAGARLRVAEAAGRLQQSTPVEAEVASARASADLAAARVAGATSALEQARLALSYTSIVAPRAGHISRLAIHPGQLVQAGQTITNLLPDVTYVIANFKETQMGHMHPGQAADIKVDALPGQTLHARVESVSLGTGAQFSMLPPDNASGNFVKVVQRVPVKLTWMDLPAGLDLAVGLSADVTVHVQ